MTGEKPSSESLRGPGILPTFLYFFTGTTLIAIFLAARVLDQPLGSGLTSELGLLVGLLGGGLATYFNRTITLEIPYTSRKKMMAQLNQVLETMGYAAAEGESDELIYRRLPLQRLFSGSIYVQFSDQVALVSSRSIHIRQLQQRLANIK